MLCITAKASALHVEDHRCNLCHLNLKWSGPPPEILKIYCHHIWQHQTSLTSGLMQYKEMSHAHVLKCSGIISSLVDRVWPSISFWFQWLCSPPFDGEWVLEGAQRWWPLIMNRAKGCCLPGVLFFFLVLGPQVLVLYTGREPFRVQTIYPYHLPLQATAN